MEKVRKGVERIVVMRASLLRKVWINVILFFLAGVMIVTGIYLSSQPKQTKGSDIQWYNQGVSAYNAADYEYFESSEELAEAEEEYVEYPVEYPIANLLEAAVYFQRTASESTDNKLKTLALYNLGTLIGRDVLLINVERMQGLGLTEGIGILEEAVRTDPNNEDAKYNLEVLEKMQALLAVSGGLIESYPASGPKIGYNPEDRGLS